MAKQTNSEAMIGAKKHDTLLERETVIRWDATGEPATLWTAETAVKNQWISYGFSVIRKDRGWACRVPLNRITYKPLKTDQKQAETVAAFESSPQSSVVLEASA